MLGGSGNLAGEMLPWHWGDAALDVWQQADLRLLPESPLRCVEEDRVFVTAPRIVLRCGIPGNPVKEGCGRV